MKHQLPSSPSDVSLGSIESNTLLEMTSLDQILANEDPKHPLGADALLKYSKTIFADENVRFLMDAKRVMSAENVHSYKILVKRYGDCLNLPRNVQAKFLTGRTNGLELAHRHIYEIVKTDICPKFLKTIKVRNQLDLSRDSALWWKSPQTFRTFFSYPDLILSSDERCHSFLNSILVIAGILIFLNFNTEFGILIYLLYCFCARALCGPKLDPQSFFVLFVCRPFFIRSKYQDVLFKNGKSIRVSEFIGALLTASALICGYFGPLIGFVSIMGILCFFCCVNAVFGFSIVHFAISTLSRAGLLSKKYDMTSNSIMGFQIKSSSRQRIDSVIVVS